jgi:hypothetical protein
MHKNKTGLIVGVALALLVAFVIAPGVQAQNTNLAPDGNPTVNPAVIRPGADTANVAIPFAYTFGTQAQYASGLAAASITVTATQKACSPYIQVIGALTKSITINPANAQQGTIKDSIAFQVGLKPDAPGLEALQCAFELQAGAGANPQAVPASNPLPTSITVKGTYIPLIQANVANGKLKSAGPQKEVPYQLELTNFGNAKTVVSFLITDQPSSGKWEALAPEQITLNTEQSGLGNKQTIPFIVSTTYKNGWNNAIGGYTLEMTPVAFIDPEAKGTPSTVNVLARVRGVYVPGVEPFVMLAAILGTALVLRMQNRDEE